MSRSKNNEKKNNGAVEMEDVNLSTMYLSMISAFPMVMRAAIELDLLEIISKAGPNAQLSPLQIASKLPTQNHPTETSMMLDRMLRLLASHSVLTCTTIIRENGLIERLYGLAPLSKYFVQDKDGISFCPFLILGLDKVVAESWYNLKDVIIKGGSPFTKAHGMSLFQYSSVDPRFNQVFNSAMFHTTSLIMNEIFIGKYKGFENLKEITDIGGGIGIAVSMITAKYPLIKGINFDLPHVVQQAPTYPGVEHVGGDMFEIIPKSETILLKWVLHNWSDENCLRILKNCYVALPNNGKVIAMDMINPTTTETNNAAKVCFLHDLIMMGLLGIGKERSEKEFEALAKEVGFLTFSVICCVFNTWIMELTK
ncbi:hypothetical protein IFM89_038840 [Coptis chinensis]|uniref:Caffeic acid O-methyltransferase n=1 Tax=Coptis chinensis TaxID=261450 RepID=A0A835I644_9MAGN|nr:hypothetical protein IFM89_038840 [Coptis chinensis]